MNISHKFNLAIQGHQDIDFIDIDLSTDTELYLDPTLIDVLPTPWCKETKKIINDYFENVFDACHRKDYARLYDIVACGKEPNETKLGVSIEQSCGKGSRPENLYKIFRSVAEDTLVEDGLVKNPAELCIFVDNFAEDRMSDLITNVIRRQLYKFTVMECEKYGVELGEKIEKLGPYWNAKLQKWEQLNDHPIMVNGRKILLVPKIVTRRKFILTVRQYLYKHVLSRRQAFHLEHRTELTHERYSKKRGNHLVPPTKEELYAKEVKGHDHKDFVRDFSKQHPRVVEEYRRQRVGERDIWDYVLTDSTLNYYVYGGKSR